ncbi:MAG: 2-C-methyl-D-erythritol 2,4-cyclodiphosphate synthase [Candidatus Eiseniibacteriota bacterium]
MNVALLLAAGRGERLGFALPKAAVPLGGRPLAAWSLDALGAADAIEGIVLVGDEATLARALEAAGDAARAKLAAVVPGGATRQESAARGLAAASPRARLVLVHDAARPFASPALFDGVAAAAGRTGAALAAVPLMDSLKRVANERVVATVERAGLWRAQTPQGFESALFRRAHAEAARAGASATDDVALVERLGHPVEIVPGAESNRKITSAEDLAWAEAHVASARGESAGSAERAEAADLRMSPRTGIGYDVHPFAPDRPLVLGGVRVPHDRGLAGHSDADALAHAVADAMLGALALGDLGSHFPDTDPAWRGADSLDLLARVRAEIEDRGYRVGNVDATVIAEAPRLAPHVDAMRERLAGVLRVATACVSVKATRHEGLGALGRGEGIAAMAIVSLIGREKR